MRLSVSILSVCLAAPGLAPAQQSMSPSGAVRVQVVDETGKPISPARVFISQALPSTATRPPAPPVITGPQVGTAYTDQNGHFVAFLPAGSYIACAETTTQGVLDPCHWATSAPTFTIKSQSTVETTVGFGLIGLFGFVLGDSIRHG